MAKLSLVMLKFLSILILCCAHVAAQSVSGRVLNATTSTGVAGVRVDLKQTGTTAYSTTTDELGDFVVEDVKDGAYTAYYSLPGYFAFPYPQSLHKPFQLKAGGPPIKLDARMIQAARITGHVVDGNGDAIPLAQLELIGSRTAFAFIADSKGRFQKELFPDTFLLSVAPPLGLKPPKPEPRGDQVLNWAKTYYPRTAARETSSKIVLRPGEAIDVELKLLPVPAHAIRGVLLMPDGTPVAQEAIRLAENSVALPRFTAVSMTDGAFEFMAIVDGHWRFEANTIDSEGNLLHLTDWVEMVGHDIDALKLSLERPFTVRGRIVSEIPDGVVPPKFPPIALRSRRRNAPQNEMGMMSILSPVAFPDASGGFELKSVYPGAYSIDVPAPPLPYYLDAVRVDGVGVTPKQVDLYGPVSLALVYKTNGGTLHGKCGSGWVPLVPADADSQWPPFVRSVQCDSDDNYEIRAVRPGDYYALKLPWDSGPGVLWVFAGKLTEQVLNQASKVTVRAGETTAADVRAIAEQQY